MGQNTKVIPNWVVGWTNVQGWCCLNQPFTNSRKVSQCPMVRLLPQFEWRVRNFFAAKFWFLWALLWQRWFFEIDGWKRHISIVAKTQEAQAHSQELKQFFCEQPMWNAGHSCQRVENKSHRPCFVWCQQKGEDGTSNVMHLQRRHCQRFRFLGCHPQSGW